MGNQVPLTQKGLSTSSRTKPNQSNDLDTGFDKDMTSQSSFTPKRSSDPNNRIKQNQSDDPDTDMHEYMENQILFTSKVSSN